jgi:hypothetical protein
MIAAAFAELVDARRTGRDKWSARCPNPAHPHGNRRASLRIGTGRDGRVTLNCFSCHDTPAILAAMHLSWCDLFPSGPPPSPAELARIEQEREEREAARLRLHQLHAEACDRFHAMHEMVSSLGRRLVCMEISPQADRITTEYHELLDDMRALERALLTVEGGPGLAAYLDLDLPPARRTEPFELIDFSPFTEVL